MGNDEGDDANIHISEGKNELDWVVTCLQNSSILEERMKLMQNKLL